MLKFKAGWVGSVELGHDEGPGRGAGQVHGVLPDHGVLRGHGVQQDHGVQLEHDGQLDGGLGWGARLLGRSKTAEGGEPAQKTS